MEGVKCPNKASASWKYLVSKVGEPQAMKVWMANGEEIPSIEQIDELIVKKEADNKKKAFEQQYVFLKRKVDRLERELYKLSPISDQYNILKAEWEVERDRLADATFDEDREEYLAMANENLDWVDTFIETLPETPDQYTMQNISNAFEILKAFEEFDDVRDTTAKLRKRLFPYVIRHNLKTINEYDNSGKVITEEMVDAQIKDIRSSSGYFGSLSDLDNYIGRTIGSVIKTAQNKSSVENKKLEAVVQEEVDKLSAYGKSRNMSLESIYDLFIQENDAGTLILTQRFDKEGKVNPNYKTIFDTQELRDFYIFYQKVLKESQVNLPYKVGKYYILNKPKSDLKSDLKRLIPVEEYRFDNFVSNEELLLDVVPDKYRKPIPAAKKSRDLGDGLLEFAAYANNHNELSKALAEVRLLQEQLKYKQTEKGVIEKRTFIKSSDPKASVNAEDSNVYKMVNTHIDMQLKGKMRVHKMKPIKLGDIKDAEGRVVGVKQIHIEDILDKGLKYNSLLRIGLSPITSIANVLFGETSNFIEAVGGRHFNISEMTSAKRIFATQIDYISKKHDTNLYKWLHKLNPLQELADYELGEGLTANPKKLTSEKAMEMMYIMQKKGELELQATTMIAMLIHEGYMTKDGKNTPKGDAITESEATKLSDKVQRLNQMIHGRYSQREAAALQQSVWYRMFIQFRKWIPAAIESRFGDLKPDNRLGVDVEGRYRTLGAKVFKASSVKEAFENMFLPLLNSKRLLESGQMTPTEIYNMRKNLVEMILLTATALIVAGLKSGDDDEDKERLRNPAVKAGLTMLNRISGDLMFFYNPSNVGNMAKNAIPMGKLISDVISVGTSLPHAFYLGDYEIKRGSLKGYNEFYFREVPRVIPMLSPAVLIQKIANTKDILPEFN